MYKKIDILYKDSKNRWHYLCSTNQSKTAREAIISFVLRLSETATYRPTFSQKVGETINPLNIYAHFDKNS